MVNRTPSHLLIPVGTASVSGSKKFVAKDHFKVDISESAAVKISYLSYNFGQLLLDKVEENVEDVTLTVYRKEESLLPAAILAELGWAAIALAHLWKLLEKQPGGEEGVLLVNGRANVFYVSDANSELWMVGVDWPGVGWHVDIDSVEHPRPSGWGDGAQVVAR
jgi:hypothetical protein